MLPAGRTGFTAPLVGDWRVLVSQARSLRLRQVSAGFLSKSGLRAFLRQLAYALVSLAKSAPKTRHDTSSVRAFVE